MDVGSGCRKQGPPNSFDRPPGPVAWCVSGGDCVVVSGRVLLPAPKRCAGSMSVCSGAVVFVIGVGDSLSS